MSAQAWPLALRPALALLSTLPLLALGACADALTPCEGYGEPEALGALDDPELVEVSGISASQFHAGTYWAHDDSDGGATVYAIDAAGQVVGAWGLTGPSAVDPEDIAIDGGRIYLADVGDNTYSRERLQIYVFSEPVPDGGGSIGDVDVIEVVLPDGPADIEAMLVDPESGDGLLIEKSGGDPRAWRVPLRDEDGAVEALGALPLGELPGEVVVTGAEASPSGAHIYLRTWAGVLVYERAEGQSAFAALQGEACLAPTASEPQGEAVAATDDGFLTLSEGGGATLWRTLRRM